MQKPDKKKKKLIGRFEKKKGKRTVRAGPAKNRGF